MPSWFLSGQAFVGVSNWSNLHGFLLARLSNGLDFEEKKSKSLHPTGQQEIMKSWQVRDHESLASKGPRRSGRPEREHEGLAKEDHEACTEREHEDKVNEHLEGLARKRA
jgi:hypothetical protein